MCSAPSWLTGNIHFRREMLTTVCHEFGMTDKNLSDAGKMGVTMGVRKIGAPYAVRFSECGSSILRSKRRFRHFSDEKTLDSSEDRQNQGFLYQGSVCRLRLSAAMSVFSAAAASFREYRMTPF
jgi:hypothetical protein